METQEKSEVEKMSAEGIAERMSDMRKTLLTLEWDKKHNQIHFGMEERYNKLKEEYEALEKQLNALRALKKEEEKEEEGLSEEEESVFEGEELEEKEMEEKEIKEKEVEEKDLSEPESG